MPRSTGVTQKTREIFDEAVGALGLEPIGERLWARTSCAIRLAVGDPSGDPPLGASRAGGPAGPESSPGPQNHMILQKTLRS